MNDGGALDDIRTEKDEIVQVETSTSAGGLDTVYIHVNGRTIVRVISAEPIQANPRTRMIQRSLRCHPGGPTD
jgi:hypothetical protein